MTVLPKMLDSPIYLMVVGWFPANTISRTAGSFRLQMAGEVF
jgi:hypothetical protein